MLSVLLGIWLLFSAGSSMLGKIIEIDSLSTFWTLAACNVPFDAASYENYVSKEICQVSFES